MDVNSDSSEDAAQAGGGDEAAREAARLALDVARAQENRLAFLARATVALGSSLDSSATAEHVARLAVPELGDVCIIDLHPTDAGPGRALAITAGLSLPAGLPDRLARAGVRADSPQERALSSGRAQAGTLGDAVAAWPSGSPEAELVEQLELRAWLALPLRSRGQTIGVATLFSGRRRGYTADEFATAGEFTSRAAAAIDNALLYEAAVRARTEAEDAQWQAQRLMEGLRESEDRYRTLFQESRDAIYITERDGGFIDANPAALDLFGCTREELMRLNALDFYLDPADRNRFAAEVERLGSVRDFEITLRRRTGDRIECLLTSIARRSLSGEVLGYQGIIRDITERKRAERRLLESEHFARTIVSSVQEGVIVCDRELRVQVWNRCMEELTGIRSADMVGRAATDPPAGSVSLVGEELLARALAGETVHAPDVQIHTDEYRARWVSAVFSPHVSLDGEIIGVVGNVHDITERKRSEAQLLHNAFHDVLTGLPNRALFVDRLERLLRHADRHPDFLFGVAFLDLDRFKEVNDGFGHIVGDDLLVSIASRLEGCVRTGDTVARFGGDEFAVLLDEVRDVTDATRVAERILSELATPFRLAGQDVHMSASIGIALSSTGYDRPEDILSDADAAMYRAKLEGRSRFEVFDRELHRRAVDALQHEADLRQALERGELEIHYQPIISLADGRITGVEALIRWAHPRRGLLAPQDFLQAAENTGAIVEIGWWVLENATQQLRRWRDAFPQRAGLFVAVNLSQRQFGQDDLVERIDSALRAAGLPPDALELDVPERVVLENDERVLTVLRTLRQLGIRLCIDDFGTGRSALAYLHAFPVDTLKIDRSFIGQIGFSSNSVKLVETIVTLGRNLGLEAAAAGVETSQQLELLRQLGPEFAQGFLFSSPRAASEIELLLRRDPAW